MRTFGVDGGHVLVDTTRILIAIERLRPRSVPGDRLLIHVDQAWVESRTTGASQTIKLTTSNTRSVACLVG